MNRLLSCASAWISARPAPVFAGLAVLFAIFAVAVAARPMRENISFFLPEDPALRRQFQAFSLTPPARLVFIHLMAEGPEHIGEFAVAAQRIGQKLQAPLFAAVHPAPVAPRADAFMRMIPSLLREEDAARFTAESDPARLRARIESLRDRLMGPESIVVKQFIPHDPLGMMSVMLRRLAESGIFAGGGGAGGWDLGQFVPGEGLPGNNGLSRLFFAETLADGMDSAQSLEVTRALEELAASMPAGIRMQALSAHQHTTANTRAVGKDMARILLASGMGLALIFCTWLRRISAIPALALPCAALFSGWGALALAGVPISGITIGFGGVVLGIVVDYALHVHCAIHAGVPRAGVAVALFRPLAFSFLTTACATGALFASSLPGMRQTGLFSLAGCAAGCILALFILPLLEKDTPAAPSPAGSDAPRRLRVRPRPYLLFLCAVAVCIWAGRGISLHSDLRGLGVRDPGLLQAERDLAERWGKGFRESAMLAAHGASLADALENADAALRAAAPVLAKTAADARVISPLPLLPPHARQEASRAVWQRFAQGNRAALVQAFGPEGHAAAAGFSPTAFVPFLRMLDAPPLPIGMDSLRDSGMDLLRALFLPENHRPGAPGQQGVDALILIPDIPDLHERLQPLLPPEVLFFSPTAVAARISGTVARDFVVMGLLALTGVSLCLLLALRSLPGFLLSLTPPLAGGAALLLVFGLRGGEMNLFTVAALPLVIGLAAEYGIFMARHCSRPDSPATPRAVLLSGLTTLAGFGSLLLASHPALHSLGMTAAVGIGAAIPAALWLVPLFAGKTEG